MTDLNKRNIAINIALTDTCPYVTKGYIPECDLCPIGEKGVIGEKGGLVGESYCDVTGCEAYAAAAKIWLFDHGHNNQILKKPFTQEPKTVSGLNLVQINANSVPSEALKAMGIPSGKARPFGVPWDEATPEGVRLLTVDKFRDKLNVRLFTKNFADKKLDELAKGGLLREKVPGGGMGWVVWSYDLGNELGFKDGSRFIATDAAGLLTDVLVVGCDEDVFHPVAHKKRNFRKLKT